MAHHPSWLDSALDKLKPQPAGPAKPAAPSANRTEWHDSVEQHHVVPGLTVHDVGLSVFGETRSLSDRPGSNEPIASARQKVAHVIINGAEEAHRRGQKPPSVHRPVEPKKEFLRNPDEQAAYESSLRAAREAYLSGHDPTLGATHFSIETTPTRANKKYQNGTKAGVPISTQSGPYRNSFLGNDVKSHIAWLNTYLPDGNDKHPATTKISSRYQYAGRSIHGWTKIFLADSTQAYCRLPFLSGSSGQISKSAKTSGGAYSPLPSVRFHDCQSLS